MICAVIDVGSTSVRLMITDGIRVQKKVNTTRLAEGMGESGVLQSINIERSAQAVAEYFFEAVSAGAEKVYAFATEAVRSAKNKQKFVDTVKKLCGLDVQILSKSDEARLGFKGAYCGGRCCVIDMGGASTELTIGTAENIVYSMSLPYGIVRLRAIEKTGVDMVAFINDKLKLYGQLPLFDNIIAIGGTITTMSAMLNELDIYNPDLINGHKITVAEIETLYDKVKNLSLEERKRLKGLPEKRADIIGSGILMYMLLLKYLGFDYLTVSESDNTEGFLIEKGVLPERFKAIYQRIL